MPTFSSVTLTKRAPVSLTSYQSFSLQPSTTSQTSQQMARTILITGASSGVGFIMANIFHAKGWNVIATMRDPRQAKMKPASDRIVIAPMDVRDWNSIVNAVNYGIKKFGRIDAIVNNAGYAEMGLFETIPHEKIIAQFEVNVLGPMNVIRAILPHFRMNKAGLIINIGAGQSIVSSPLASVYSASKFAIDGFLESLSYELAPVGVIVKQIIPHGNISGTNFNTRQQNSLASNSRFIPEYAGFYQKVFDLLRGKRFRPSLTPEDVALTVYDAIHDGSKKLRYFVGADKYILSARYGTTSDEEYMLRMNAFYRP